MPYWLNKFNRFEANWSESRSYLLDIRLFRIFRKPHFFDSFAYIYLLQKIHFEANKENLCFSSRFSLLNIHFEAKWQVIRSFLHKQNICFEVGYPPNTAHPLSNAHCLLSTAHCLISTVHCPLSIANCLLHCLLFGGQFLLSIARSPLSTDHRLLPLFLAHCILPTVYCPLCTAHCLLPNVSCLLSSAHCLLPNALCLLLTIYWPVPTVYCSIFNKKRKWKFF